MHHIDCLEGGLNKSSLVMNQLSYEATATNSEGLSAERTMLFSERCSSSLQVRMRLSRRTDETWEVELGKCTQDFDCGFNFAEELADLKRECMKQSNLYWMCAQQTEAEMP